MAAVMPVPAASRVLMSGNEAVARAVWEAGVRVAAAYPGTPSTEMLEVISTYPDLYAEWSVNEKVSLEVAIGAAYAGSRSFCCMKHVGMNVASDALMTLTLTGVIGGLVIAIADDVGLSSSQNEQDSRYWGRFAHVPVLEPADSQEAYAMTLDAYELSERFQVPVILRMTTRINHVKGLVTVGERGREGVGRLQEGSGALGDDAVRRRQAHPADVRPCRRTARGGRGFAAQFHRTGQRPARRFHRLRPGLHARQGIFSGRAGAQARLLLSGAVREMPRTGGAGRSGRRRRGSRTADRNRTEGAGHQGHRQGNPATAGRTVAATCCGRPLPGCSAKTVPENGQIGGRPQPCRSFRGRRRCAWPARTSASITPCRRCAT